MKTWFVPPYICLKTKQPSNPKGFRAGSGRYLAYGLLACSSRWGLAFLLGEALRLKFVVVFPSGSSPSVHLLDLRSRRWRDEGRVQPFVGALLKRGERLGWGRTCPPASPLEILPLDVEGTTSSLLLLWSLVALPLRPRLVIFSPLKGGKPEPKRAVLAEAPVEPFQRCGGRGAAWRGWERLGMTRGTCLEHQRCFPKPRGKAPGSSIPRRPHPCLVCARSPLRRGDKPRAALVPCPFPGEPALVAAPGERL